MGAEQGVATLLDPPPTSSRGEQGWRPPATGGKKQGQVGAAWGTTSFPQGLGLSVCSCPRPRGTAALLPTVLQPGAARVHPLGGRNRHVPGIPTSTPAQLLCADAQGRRDGVSGSSSPLPQDPTACPWGWREWLLFLGCSRQTWGARAASGCVCVPQQGAPALTPSPSTGVPPSPGSSPVLHHVHHHPVRGVHRLADQVLEEDEGLHEEVLPKRGDVGGWGSAVMLC